MNRDLQIKVVLKREKTIAGGNIPLTLALSDSCRKVFNSIFFFDKKVAAKAGYFFLHGRNELFFVGQVHGRSEIYKVEIIDNERLGEPQLLMSSPSLAYGSPAYTVADGVVALADNLGDSQFELTAQVSDDVKCIRAKRELYSVNNGKWLLLLYGDTYSSAERVSVRPNICQEFFPQTAAILENVGSVWKIVVKIMFDGAFHTGHTENERFLLVGTSRGCIALDKSNLTIHQVFTLHGVFFPRLDQNWLYYCAFQGNRRQIYRAWVASMVAQTHEESFDRIELLYSSPFDCTLLEQDLNFLYFVESQSHCHRIVMMSKSTLKVGVSHSVDGQVYHFVVLSNNKIIASLCNSSHPNSLYLIDLTKYSLEGKNLFRVLPLAKLLKPFRKQLLESPLGTFWQFNGVDDDGLLTGPKLGKKLLIGLHAGHPYEATCTYSPITHLFMEKGFTLVGPNYAFDIAKNDFASFEERAASIRLWILYFIQKYQPATVIVIGGSVGAVALDPIVWSPEYQNMAHGYILLVPMLFQKHERKSVVGSIGRPTLYVHGKNDIYCDWSKKEAILRSQINANRPVSYICFEDAGHDGSEFTAQLFTIATVDQFVTFVENVAENTHDVQLSADATTIKSLESPVSEAFFSLPQARPRQANYSVVVYMQTEHEVDLVLTIASLLINTPDQVNIFVALNSGQRFSKRKLEYGFKTLLSNCWETYVAKLNSRDTQIIHLHPLRSVISKVDVSFYMKIALLASFDVYTEFYIFLNSETVVGRPMGLRLENSVAEVGVETVLSQQTNKAIEQPLIIDNLAARKFVSANLTPNESTKDVADFYFEDMFKSALLSLPPASLVAFDIQSVFDKQFFLPFVFDNGKPFGIIRRYSEIDEEIKLDYLASSLGIQLFPVNPPLVSCLMVTRLRLNYVKVAYRCFVNQTYPNKELVVVPDDDPETAAWFKSLGDPRVRVIEYSRPTDGSRHTLGRLRNVSIDNAKGEYVTVWDDDDYYHPCRVGLMMKNMIDRNVECVILGHVMAVWIPKATADSTTQKGSLTANNLCSFPAQNPAIDVQLPGFAIDESKVPQEVLEHVQKVRNHSGRTAILIMGYDQNTNEVELVGYDDTRNAFNVFIEVAQESRFQIHFLLLKPHPMVKRISSYKADLVLMTALKSVDHHAAAAAVLPSVKQLFGPCGQEVVLAPPEGPYARVTSFRAWEPTLLIKRSVAPRYPALRKREDTKFVESFMGKTSVLTKPSLSVLYLYRIHASNTWGVTHFEVLFTLGESPSYHFCIPPNLTNSVSTQLLEVLSAKFSNMNRVSESADIEKRPIFDVKSNNLNSLASFCLAVTCKTKATLIDKAKKILYQISAGKAQQVVEQYCSIPPYRYGHDATAFVCGDTIDDLKNCFHHLAVTDHDSTTTEFLHQQQQQPKKLNWFCRENAVAGKCPMVFVFPGQGGNWSKSVKVASDLMSLFPSFKRAIERCDAVFCRHFDSGSISQVFQAANTLSPPPSRLPVDPPANLALHHSCIFALRFGLFCLWQSLGLRPFAVIGHSLGEYVAAVACEILTVDSALGMLIERAKLIQEKLADKVGAMAAISGIDRQTLTNLLVKLGIERKATIAVSNSATSFVLSGEKECIDRVLAAVNGDQKLASVVKSVILNTANVAYHSSFVDCIREPFEKVVKNAREQQVLKPTSPSCHFFVTGVNDDSYTNNLSLGPATCPAIQDTYWVSQTRNEVNFHAAVQNCKDFLLEQPSLAYSSCAGIFLEVSPVDILLNHVQQQSSKEHRNFFASISSCDRKIGDTFNKIWNASSKLICFGVSASLPAKGLAAKSRGIAATTHQTHQLQQGAKKIGGKSGDDLEQTVINVFRDFFNTPSTVVDMNADLTQFGMDSLHAMQAAARLSEKLGVEVEPEIILENESMSKVIASLRPIVKMEKQRVTELDTTNGKTSSSSIRQESQISRQELLTSVISVVTSLLNVSTIVDVNADLMEFGMDSLHAMQGAARLAQRLEIEVEPEVFLENPSVNAIVLALHDSLSQQSNETLSNDTINGATLSSGAVGLDADQRQLKESVTLAIKELLNVEVSTTLDPNADLMELGMDSLHAMQGAARLARRLGIEVEPEVFLENSSANEIISAIQRKIQANGSMKNVQPLNSSAPTKINHKVVVAKPPSNSSSESVRQVKQLIALPSEREMLQDTPVIGWMVLHCCLVVRNLEFNRLATSWDRLCLRHHALRSFYENNDEHGWVRLIEPSGSPVQDKKFEGHDDFQNFILAEGHQILRYERPLCRCYSIRLPNNSSRVVIMGHHILMDLFALHNIVIPNLISLYRNIDLPPVKHNIMQVYLSEKQKRYWKQQMDLSTTRRREVLHQQSAFLPQISTVAPWKIPVAYMKNVPVMGLPNLFFGQAPVVTGDLLNSFTARFRQISKLTVVAYALIQACMSQTGQTRGVVCVVKLGRSSNAIVRKLGDQLKVMSNWPLVMNCFKLEYVILELTGDMIADLENFQNQLFMDRKANTHSIRSTANVDNYFILNYHTKIGDLPVVGNNTCHNIAARGTDYEDWRQEKLNVDFRVPIPSARKENFLNIEEGANGDLYFNWSFSVGTKKSSCIAFMDDTTRILNQMVQNESTSVVSSPVTSGAPVIPTTNFETLVTHHSLQSEKRSVLICAHPMHSRMNQILPIVKILSANCYIKVVMLGTNAFRDRIEASGAQFEGMEADKLVKAGDSATEWVPAQFALWMMKSATHKLPKLLELIKNQEQKFDLIMCDSSFWAGMFAAEMLRIPVLLLHMGLAVNREFSWVNFDIEKQKPIKEVFEYYMNLLSKKYGLKRRSADDLWRQPDCAASLAFVADKFQPARNTFSENTFFVGPSIPPEYHHASLETTTATTHSAGLEYFPVQLGVDLSEVTLVYISLGTIYNLNEQFYKTCFQVFGNRNNCRVLLVVGKQIDTAKLPSPPNNFRLHTFVPQLEVLRHANVFVTHGGVNSVQEALWFAVPMIVVPQQLDQFVVARRVKELGVGTFVDGVDQSSLNSAYDDVMESSNCIKTIQNFQCQMRKQQSENPAVTVVNNLLNSNIS